MTRAWLNGRPVEPEETCISPLDRGFTLGDGVFETIAVYNGRPFDLDAHLGRLAHGLEVLGFGDAVSLPGIRREMKTYLAQERVGTAALRLTITRGAGPRGLAPPADPRPTVLMLASLMPPRRERPLSAVTAVTVRRNELSRLSRIKALPYLDNLLALREALAKGAEEGLLLNTRGLVACASISNVFVIRNERLLTPPVADGALPGTMRAIVLTLAGSAGLAAREQSLSPDDLAAADTILLTNSLRGLQDIGEMDGRALPRRAVQSVDRLRGLVADRIAAECGEARHPPAT